MFSDKEVIIAQELGAGHKSKRHRKTNTGTLVLTNKRIVFVSGNQVLFEDFGKDHRVFSTGDTSEGTLPTVYFFDIHDASEIPKIDEAKDEIISIPLSLIVVARGSKNGIMRRPSLRLTWGPIDETERDDEFVEFMIGKRKKNLDDWATVILGLKSNELDGEVDVAIARSHTLPDTNSIGGKILYILGDMQKKGIFQIQSEFAAKFERVDIEAIEETCESLENEGWILNQSNPNEIKIYERKPILQGENDLSS